MRPWGRAKQPTVLIRTLATSCSEAAQGGRQYVLEILRLPCRRPLLRDESPALRCHPEFGHWNGTNHDSRRYYLLLAGEHVDKAYAAGNAVHREVAPIGRQDLPHFGHWNGTNHDSRRYYLLLAGEHVDKAYAAGNAVHREVAPIGRQDLP